MSQIYADCHELLEGFEDHDAALRWIPEGATVLDVGCATGYFAKRLVEEKGCTVAGIEGDREAADKARAVCERMYVGDLSDRRFLEGVQEQVGVVFLGDVVEHLADPAPLLRLSRGWLAPGGFLVCSVPNVAFWKIRFELARGRFDYREIGILDRTHLRFYTRRSFEELLAECGFRTIETAPVCSDAGALRLRAPSAVERPSPSHLRVLLLKRFPALMATQSLFRSAPATSDAPL